MVRHRVMFVLEAQFGIGGAVRRGADVGADTRDVSLKREHVQVAHDLHKFASLVAFRNLDFDGRRIRLVALRGPNARLGQGRFLLAMLDGGDAAFDRAHTIEVFVEFFLIGFGEPPPQVACTGEDQVQHLPIERAGLRRLAGLVGLALETVLHGAGIFCFGYFFGVDVRGGLPVALECIQTEQFGENRPLFLEQVEQDAFVMCLQVPGPNLEKPGSQRKVRVPLRDISPHTCPVAE